MTHDSIIVQIPRLHGQVNNRLDKVLSIFDQTRKDPENQQMLTLDDNQYSEDDVEMQRILRRLLMATTNADMRMDMNVEDEYYSIIESRDTEIMMRNRELAAANAQLKQKDAQLEQKDAQLRSSLQMLVNAGLSIEEIATKAGMAPEDVRRIVKG